MTVKSRKTGIILITLIAAFALAIAVLFGGSFVAHAVGDGNLFPNGDFEGDGANWTNSGGTPVISTDEFHSGEKSLKVTQFWARTNLRGDASDTTELFSCLSAGVDAGVLYRMSMWTKSSADTTTTLGAALIITGILEGGGYKIASLGMFGGQYFYSYNDNWTERNSVFGFTKDADGKMVLFVDGKTSTTEFVSLGNLDFDLGSNGSGSWFDDISVIETTYSRDVRIVLKDGAETVSGKTITVKDASGIPLETQPEITESNGIYTVKNLTFNTLKDTYKYSVEGYVGLSDGVITALNANYEMGVSAYSATVTVKDESDGIISDADVSASVAGAPVDVVNNGDGTYTIDNLFSAVDITVSKEGLIDKNFRLTAADSSRTIVLFAEKTATVITGNLFVNGNFEDVLDSGSQEPGKWNAEGSSNVARTTNNQQDGKYSLQIEGTAAYRIDLGSIKTDGTKYILTFAAMTETNAKIKVDMRPTVTNSEGYAYPRATLVSEKELSAEFEKTQADFSITFDELAKTVSYTVNGESVEVSTEVAAFAAIDFVFESADGIYMDNVCLSEAYDIEFTVRDGSTEITEGLIFEIVGSDGRPWNVTPVYSNGKWRIPDASGSVRVTVKSGEKAFPVAVFDSRNTSAIVENGFDLTVTLKDNNDAPVKGATIVARRGVSDLFTMTDNGDGTYSYIGASGTFNLYVTLDGYVFPVERNVSSANASVTIKATTSPVVPDDEADNSGGNSGNESDTNKKGCGCKSVSVGESVTAAFAVIALTFILGFRLIKKKRG